MSVSRPWPGTLRAYRAAEPLFTSRAWLWMAGYTLLAYLFALHALVPVVPGTSFSLVSLPVALLGFALIVRPATEAPFYALIHTASWLLFHAGVEYHAFALTRLAIEIAEAVALATMLLGYFYPRLDQPRFVVGYHAAVLALTALGGGVVIAAAHAAPSLGIEPPPVLIERPGLAWRHWWLAHACSYLAVAGPVAVLLALRENVKRTLTDPRSRWTLLWMTGALLVAALIAFPVFDLSWIGLPADVKLAMRLLPLPFAMAMAARFRAKGASIAVIILVLIIILSLTGPAAPTNWAGLPPSATPTQALLLMTATTCMMIGAMSRQLLKATADALEANQAKARFVAMLNHELRTPLNAILGFSELMRLQKMRDLDEAVGPIENIYASGQRLLAMIEGLLAQADRGASAFELHKHPLRLHQLVTEVVDQLLSGLVAFRYPIAIDIPEELQIDADARALEQILLVLLAYPLRFVSPWTSIAVRAFQSGTDTVLEVASEGLSGAVDDERDKLELQLAKALALAHGARLTIAQTARETRVARLTFFATRAAG